MIRRSPIAAVAHISGDWHRAPSSARLHGLVSPLFMDTAKPETARLRVLTLDPNPSRSTADLIAVVSSCSGSYLCECESCRADRARRVSAGVRKGRQPWQSKRPIRGSRPDTLAA